MKYAALILAGLVLVSCTREQAVVVETDRKGEFVALIEQSGCRLDPATSDEILIPAGFSDQEASQLGGQLVNDGVADVSKDGILILRTEPCL